jgi:tetratricopeptide (TPR) repeat protein
VKKKTAGRVLPEKAFPLLEIGLGASILCATLIAYWPALHGGLLWDDAGHVTRPSLRSLHGLWRIWFDLSATQQYYPLLHTAFWFEHRLWGDSVLGYHLMNVFLHAAAACLVVVIVRRLALPGAWLAGFLFALHPVCVEAVAWISEQKSTLSAVFYLASGLAYLCFDRSRRRSHYAAALGLFVLALLSKTVTATLPAALLLVFWFQRGRIDWKRDARPLLPWFALGVAGGLFTAWVERSYIGAQGTPFARTPAERFLVAGRAIWFYLGKLVWPVDLIFSYPRWTVDAGEWWQYLFPLGALAAAWGLWIVARKHRGPLAGFLFFAGTVFPALGFFNVFPFVYSYVADHFQYLATLGIIVPAASGLAMAAKRLPAARRRYASACGLGLAAVLGGLTWAQSGMYRDAEALYSATLARNPGAWMAHTNLGVGLAAIPGRLAEAIGHFQAALRIDPASAEAHHDLGLALLQVPGRTPEALTELYEALRLNPKFVEAHASLGLALSKVPGQLPNAIAEYRTALAIRPGYAAAHSGLGDALSGEGRFPEAVVEYQEALRLEPADSSAHTKLGGALREIPGRLPDAIAECQAGVRLDPNSPTAHSALADAYLRLQDRWPDALAEYETALRLKPDFAEAHTNLGATLLRMGRAREALAEYRAALRIRPDYAEAHYDLGNLLSDMGGGGGIPEAVAEYREALRIKPDYPEAHANLALALSDIPGRMPEAIAEYQAALRSNPNLVEAHYNLGLLLAKIPGHSAEAVAHLEAALRLRPDLQYAREVLARLRSR